MKVARCALRVGSEDKMGVGWVVIGMELDVHVCESYARSWDSRRCFERVEGGYVERRKDEGKIKC